MKPMTVILSAALLLSAANPAVAQHHHHGHTAPDFQRLAVDEPAAGFILTDQDGKRIGLADLLGSAVVLTFMYTTCTDICPVLFHTLAETDAGLTAAERAKVRFVAVTVDPLRDTPARLTEFLAERQLAAERWRLLTGAVAEVRKVANDYGVVVRPGAGGDFVHNSVFVVIDADGRERVELHGSATPSEALVAELRKVLK